MTPAMQDRLKLDEKRISSIANAVLKVKALPDPIGEEIGGWLRPNGASYPSRTSYGNPDLSLDQGDHPSASIKSMALPEMPVYFGTTQAHSSSCYWLVNDDNDAMGQPDMLYCEDGTTYPVTDHSNHARLTYDGDGKWTVTTWT